MILLAFAVASVAAADPAPTEVAIEVQPSADAWAGEHKRWHFGVGYRGHLGMMASQGTPFLVLQNELLGVFNLRAGDHNEFRVELGFAAGYPDTFAGESNISFRWALNERVYLGIGVLGFWGFWSLRYGVEVPLAIRLDKSRRHELTIALRCTAGVYNNDTFVWYDFAYQRFAIAGDLVLGYSFIF